MLLSEHMFNNNDYSTLFSAYLVQHIQLSCELNPRVYVEEQYDKVTKDRQMRRSCYATSITGGPVGKGGGGPIMTGGPGGRGGGGPIMQLKIG